MEQQIKFRKEKTWDGKTLFIKDEITITIQVYTRKNGLHEITYPRTASAQFVCNSKKYVVSNWEAFATVEDWYIAELLPKFRLLSLLLADVDEPEMCE
jgi:hypothetical protein